MSSSILTFNIPLTITVITLFINAYNTAQAQDYAPLHGATSCYSTPISPISHKKRQREAQNERHHLGTTPKKQKSQHNPQQVGQYALALQNALPLKEHLEDTNMVDAFQQMPVSQSDFSTSLSNQVPSYSEKPNAPSFPKEIILFSTRFAEDYTCRYWLP